MSDIDPNNEAAAAPTAHGLEDVKANLTVIDNTDDQVAPEEPRQDAILIDGADLLNRIHDFVLRFVCFPSYLAGISYVSWIAHTHLMDAWFSSPRIAFLSPEPGSGKSRALEIMKLLVPNPVLSVNSSSAYIMRKIADQENRPTILIDEIDTIFGPNARGNEELRGSINAGYRKGVTSGRCATNKDAITTVEFPTYAAIAMGGLGNLPNTIMSRSINIYMQRRKEGEKVEPFKPKLHEPVGCALRDELVAWAASVATSVESTTPILPDGITDRNAEVWEPILIVGDLAGGRWPGLARQAAIEAVCSAKANEKPSLEVQLLADIRSCFGTENRLTSADLLAMLLLDEEAPWGDIKGKKLNPRTLAEMLRGYGIKSGSIRMPDGSTPKGYRRHSFEDAWKRYLPASESGATNATDATSDENVDETMTSSVADTTESSKCGGDGKIVAEPER